MAEFLNANIKYLRNETKLSQQALADKIGVDRSTISRIENNEIETTIDNAIKIANAFNIDLSDLVGKDLRLKQDVPESEYDKKLKQLETDTGVKISYASDKELTNEDYLAINELVLEVLKEQKDDKK